MQTVRIGADEDIDDMKGLKPEEISERIQHKEAKAHAQILEMVSSNVNSLTYPWYHSSLCGELICGLVFC